MNNVVLIGRLTKDPEVRYTAETQLAVGNFTLGINRPTVQGKEKQADFPRVTVFGKLAENCEKFLTKGKLVGVHGRIQTGSYKNKEGVTVYTTVVVASSVEFLERGEGGKEHSEVVELPGEENIPEGFSAMDKEDIPF